MIVIDTNVISEVIRPLPDEHVLEWLITVGEDAHITTITLAEICTGLQRLPTGRRKTTLGKQIDSALKPYLGTGAILPFDEAAAFQYSFVVNERQTSGQPISMADAQIAAICRSTKADLATRNTSDFTGIGISLINPWQ